MTNITISQTQVFALRTAGYNRTQMAAHFGVTTEEMFQVMKDFGLYKTKDVVNPAYKVVLEYDLPQLTSLQIVGVINDNPDEESQEEAGREVVYEDNSDNFSA